jgi:hypothetical protein
MDGKDATRFSGSDKSAGRVGHKKTGGGRKQMTDPKWLSEMS